jgi:hypothetical protein
MGIGGLTFGGCVAEIGESGEDRTPDTASVSEALTYNADGTYYLPYAYGKKMKVTAGNCAETNHSCGSIGINSYAFDFDDGSGHWKIYAARGGKAFKVQIPCENVPCNDAGGNQIKIDHGDGTHGLYMHLHTLGISQGQWIKQGQYLGTAGKTGNATGIHLHFVVVNASNYVSRKISFHSSEVGGDGRPATGSWPTSRNLTGTSDGAICGVTPFTDICSSKFKGDIEWAWANGITSGCSAHEFCPTAYVARDQAASFLARRFDYPAPPKDYFSDDNDNSHEYNINRIAAAGVTSGCGGSKYCPDSLVKRDAMATFLARAGKLPSSPKDYFSDDDGNPHEANINKIAHAGITSGCGSGKYCPEGVVTRGQAMAFLRRMP